MPSSDSRLMTVFSEAWILLATPRAPGAPRGGPLERNPAGPPPWNGPTRPTAPPTSMAPAGATRSSAGSSRACWPPTPGPAGSSSRGHRSGGPARGRGPPKTDGAEPEGPAAR